MANDKQNIQHKLERLFQQRPTINTLKQRCIYKCFDTCDQKTTQYKQTCELITKHLIEKQRRARENMRRKKHFCRRRYIYLKSRKYKCYHCEKTFDVEYFAKGDNVYFHRCYATPYHKKMNNLSLQMLLPNSKSKNCKFEHNGNCLIVLKNNLNKQQTSADVSLKEVNNIKQRVKDIVFGYIKMIQVILPDTTYFHIPAIIKYWCLLYYYSSKTEHTEIGNILYHTKIRKGKRTKKTKSDLPAIYSKRSISKKRKHRKTKLINNLNYTQAFKLNENQIQLVDELKRKGGWLLLKLEIKEFGKISFDEESGSLKIEVNAVVYKDEVLQIIQKQLGLITENKIKMVTSQYINLYDVKDINQSAKDTVSGYIKKIRDYVPPIVAYWCLLYYYEKQNELIFPLTDKQMKLLANSKYLGMLTNDMKHFGRVRVNNGVLMLSIPIHVSIMAPMDKLEKRLGVLLSVDEIKQIRQEIVADKTINISDIDELKMDDKQFINHMMICVECGMKFIKHKKRGICDERFIVVHKNRLYWKTQQDGINHRSRSMHFAKVMQVMIGKNTKALRHDSLNTIPENCCFSVIAKKATLDLSIPSLNHVHVRLFTAYLRALHRHVKTLSMRISSIGVGFNVMD